MSAPTEAVVLFWAIASFLALSLYLVVNWIADRLVSRRAAGRLAEIRAPFPRPYAGCITCEAAESTSSSAMVRHQAADHSGGIQW